MQSGKSAPWAALAQIDRHHVQSPPAGAAVIASVGLAIFHVPSDRRQLISLVELLDQFDRSGVLRVRIALASDGPKGLP